MMYAIKSCVLISSFQKASALFLKVTIRVNILGFKLCHSFENDFQKIDLITNSGLYVIDDIVFPV